MEFNLADLLECVADTVADREAVVCGDRRLTLGQLDERATRLAHGLSDLGVVAGDHVGLYLFNCPEYLEAMLACFKLRAVPLNINYRYLDDELAHVCADGDVVCLVFHAELGPRVAAARRREGGPRHVVAVAGAMGTAGAGESGADAVPHAVPEALDYEDLVSSGHTRRDFASRSPDDHYILYTGGTTGRPKGVVWRHEDILFAALGGGNPGGPPIQRPEEIARTVLTSRSQRVRPYLAPGDPGPEEFRALSLGPLMHAGGQWMALGTLLGGGTVVLYPHRHLDAERVLALVAGERATMLTLVGDAGARPLAEHLASGGNVHDTSTLRLLGSGGAMLSATVKAALLAALPTVLAIIEAVGSSEAPVQAVAISTGDGAPSPSLHFNAPEITMVVDDDLRPLDPGSGRIGRLATRGRVPLGYYKDPAMTARTFVEIDGARWSLPGDMATLEADGSIRLLGRGALCINTGGEKVYPEEVEAVVKTHPLVIDAMVVGCPDAHWGERVVAIVQPAAGQAGPDLASVQAHCRGRLADYKTPRALHVVDVVRRSPAGKADYAWARALVAGAPTAAEEPAGVPPAPAGPPGEETRRITTNP